MHHAVRHSLQLRCGFSAAFLFQSQGLLPLDKLLYSGVPFANEIAYLIGRQVFLGRNCACLITCGQCNIVSVW